MAKERREATISKRAARPAREVASGASIKVSGAAASVHLVLSDEVGFMQIETA